MIFEYILGVFFFIMTLTCYLLWFSQQAFEYCYFYFVDESTTS